MRRATLNEAMRMRFGEVRHRHAGGRLGCDEAADILDVSVSTFNRMR